MNETIKYLAARNGVVEWQHRVAPPLPPLHVLVRVKHSAISVGTELLTIAKSLSPQFAEPNQLGYQCSGFIEESRVDDPFLQPGAMVACYGSPYVQHASVLQVPRHLVAPVSPLDLLEDAAYCGLGTIAIHAFRSTRATLGETVAIIGLGMLGNLIAQVAQAAGCQVFATDAVEQRRHFVQQFGVPVFDDSQSLAFAMKQIPHGADAVVIAASNANTELLTTACEMVRPAGCVAIVGLSDSLIPRELLFQKELRLVVPRAGGPGRYDAQYETGGVDYPIQQARWTEHRNLQEFIRLLSAGDLRFDKLYSSYPVTEALPLYESLSTNRSAPGFVLNW